MLRKKVIIVRIAEGLGNQLFMFANAYALAKSRKYLLMIDDESGYFKNKNQLRKRTFLLNYFNIQNYLTIYFASIHISQNNLHYIRKFLHR